MADDLLVAFALKSEASVLLRRLKKELHMPVGPGEMYRGVYCDCEVTVLILGMGSEAAIETLNAWYDKGFRAKNALLGGFAGATHAGVPLNTCWWFTEVIDVESGEHLPLKVPETIERSRHLKIRKLATTQAPVLQRKMREAIFSMHQADAVDMETFSIARWMADKGIELSCIRGITDELDDDIPKWIWSLGNCRSKRQLAKNLVDGVVTYPEDFMTLLRLRDRAAKVGRALSAELTEIIGSHGRWDRQGRSSLRESTS